jgi:hypothetical protein
MNIFKTKNSSELYEQMYLELELCINNSEILQNTVDEWMKNKRIYF